MSIAGQFKNAIQAGVGKTVDNDGFTTIYTTPSTTETYASYIIECDISCVGDSGVQTSVRIKKANGTKAHLVKNAPVPVGSSIQIIDGQKLVLESGDSLEVRCDTTGEEVDVIVSLVQNVNT